MESATNTEASLILENGTHPQIYNSVMERTTKKNIPTLTHSKYVPRLTLSLTHKTCLCS